jgi:uracil-DNA glycosylase
VITAVAQREQPVVFMLWGAHAQAKQKLIALADPLARHRVLQANHPSPLSALRGPTPFMGCGHFSAANAFLQKNAQNPIVW